MHPPYDTGNNRKDIVAELLCPGRVLVGAQASDKWDAIRQLSELFVRNGDLNPAACKEALEAVFERERVASTGIGRGFAIPHGVYDGLDAEIGSLGIFRDGVDFAAHDGMPSQIVLVLLYPSSTQKDHLENVASAVRFFSCSALTPKLLAAQHPEEAYASLHRRNCEETDDA